MKKSPIIFGFLVAILASSAWASGVHWSVWGLPDQVVVGTLQDIEKNLLQSRFRPPLRPLRLRAVQTLYDSGWIVVERVLEGDTSAERIPVVWGARERCFPPVWCEPCTIYGAERHKLGERRIWVIWKPHRLKGPSYAPFPAPFSKYWCFQALPVRKIAEVESKLEELRSEETEKPLPHEKLREGSRF